MKGDNGDISNKGLEVKIGYGLRSRSQRGVQDIAAPVVIDVLKQSCWANLPPELLRDVLVRLEASESVWPLRKHVVSCAGVCRSWREIMKEIVMTPEISGKLTFPISLKQPGPRDTLLPCFIKRNRNTQTYCLYLGLTQALTDKGKFLLAARKCRRATCTDYIISLDEDDMSKGSGTYIGKLRSNFLGTKFTVYDGQPPFPGAMITKTRSTRLVGLKQVSPKVPAGNYPVAHIAYELNVMGSRGPRRMQCVMDSIPSYAADSGGLAPTPTEFPSGSPDLFPSLPFFRSKSTRLDSFLSGPMMSKKDGTLVLKNKAPRWHAQLQCWCLNFHGRVTVASVKNFQLVASENGQEHETVLLQFGKVVSTLKLLVNDNRSHTFLGKPKDLVEARGQHGLRYWLADSHSITCIYAV
ncbi:hypothetical protein MRB53_030969 [Persea americana]|uniref:Uncharacterized protein n=1 Tax=Persea americana TaxID=3435 RepID=A0ACC2KMR9_PERAE|nr:hypothetical protein MRB53_030969 [Persea americana]